MVFTDKLEEKKIGFIAFLLLYFLFILGLSLIVIRKLHQWHSLKKKILNENKNSEPKILADRKIEFSVDGSFMDMLNTTFGNSLFKVTQLGFETADVILLKNSLIIFGKGHNNIVSSGKLVYYPFEINLRNEFLTELNKVEVLDFKQNEEHLEMQLKASGFYKKFDFKMTINDFKIKTAGNKGYNLLLDSD